MCDIPDNEILYRYAKPEAFPTGQTKLPTGIFNDKELSCDWKKYRKNPRLSNHVTKYGRSMIVAIKVCEDIRRPRNPKRGNLEPSWEQKIIHDPIQGTEKIEDNKAHSLIKGKKKAAVLDAIRDNAELI